MKTKYDILNQMDEVIQYFINHPDNQPNTDHCRNVDRLINLKSDLANGYNTENKPSINYNGVLAAGYSYKTEEFQLIPDEETHELKIIALNSKKRLYIKPNSDNSCTLTACR